MHLKCRVYLSSDFTLCSLGNTEAPASATIRVTILDHHIYTLVATGFSVCLFPDERLNLEVIWVNVQNFQYIGNKMFAHQPVYSLRSVSNAFVCCTFVSKSRTAKPTHDNLFDIWITFFFFLIILDVTVLIFPHLTLNIVFSWRQVSEAQDESLFVSLFFSFFPLIHRWEMHKRELTSHCESLWSFFPA